MGQSLAALTPGELAKGLVWYPAGSFLGVACGAVSYAQGSFTATLLCHGHGPLRQSIRGRQLVALHDPLRHDVGRLGGLHVLPSAPPADDRR